MRRTTARAAGALALAALTVVLFAAPARAAAYRYWTYWQGSNGSWAFATGGPASAVPRDGSVEGWAFRISGAAADPDAAPADAPDFASACATTPAEPGRKRVAVVVDSGTAAIAPDGQVPPAALTTCVVAEPDATGYEILRSIAEVRVEGGLVCGVAGYPSGECAPVLDDAEVQALLASSGAAPSTPAAATPAADGTAAEAPESTGTPGSPLATIVVAAALLVGAAAWAWGRRRSGR